MRKQIAAEKLTRKSLHIKGSDSKLFCSHLITQ